MRQEPPAHGSVHMQYRIHCADDREVSDRRSDRRTDGDRREDNEGGSHRVQLCVMIEFPVDSTGTPAAGASAASIILSIPSTPTILPAVPALTTLDQSIVMARPVMPIAVDIAKRSHLFNSNFASYFDKRPSGAGDIARAPTDADMPARAN